MVHSSAKPAFGPKRAWCWRSGQGCGSWWTSRPIRG